MVIKRYIILFWELFSLCLRRAFEHRADFFASFLASIVSILLFWTLLEAIFINTNSVAGATKYELILTYGFVLFLRSLLDNIIFKNLSSISNAINEGELDSILAKPANPLFLLSFRKISIFELSEAVIGICIILYAIPHLNIQLTLLSLFKVFLAIICLLFIFYGMLLTFFSLSFRVGLINHGIRIYNELVNVARLPFISFKDMWSILFVFILPVVLYGSIPTAILMGNFNSKYLLSYLLLSIFWFNLGILSWKKGLKSYTSAGG